MNNTLLNILDVISCKCQSFRNEIRIIGRMSCSWLSLSLISVWIWMCFADDCIGLATYTEGMLALVALRTRMFMCWQLMDMCGSERNDTWNKFYHHWSIFIMWRVSIEAGEAYSGPHLIPGDSNSRAGYSAGGEFVNFHHNPSIIINHFTFFDLKYIFHTTNLLTIWHNCISLFFLTLGFVLIFGSQSWIVVSHSPGFGSCFLFFTFVLSCFAENLSVTGK